MSFNYASNGQVSGIVTTTNATPTTILSFDMSDITENGSTTQSSSVAVFHIDVIAQEAATGKSYARSTVVGVKFTTAASPLAAILGSEAVVLDVADMGITWSASVGIDGVSPNLFVVKVTGEAGKTIDWRASGSLAAAGF